MKKIFFSLMLAITFLFSQCGSIKFKKNPSFKITSAVYNNWAGGVPGVGGTNVIISYTTNSIVTFDSIYFLKRRTKLQSRESKKTKLIIGYFNNKYSNGKHDLILHADAQKEMGNKVPEIKKVPFDLKESEAVISYKINNKIKYFKIKSVKKGKTLFYPSAPKQ